MEMMTWLRQESKQRGWNLADFAERAKLPPERLEATLSGQQPPDFEFCYGVADALGKQAERLLHMAGLLSNPALKLANDLAYKEVSPEYVHRLVQSVSVEERRLIVACAERRGKLDPLYNEIRPRPDEFNAQERRQDRIRFAAMILILLLILTGVSVAFGLILLM